MATALQGTGLVGGVLAALWKPREAHAGLRCRCQHGPSAALPAGSLRAPRSRAALPTQRGRPGAPGGQQRQRDGAAGSAPRGTALHGKGSRMPLALRHRLPLPPAPLCSRGCLTVPLCCSSAGAGRPAALSTLSHGAAAAPCRPSHGLHPPRSRSVRGECRSRSFLRRGRRRVG